ncbi:competence-damage inducible regulator [Petrocella atlantisensis]|uniref:Putative competence-damage inducible protein n=1 Tax=Petrocella atlantisensis TaxID=2173034 RepID=A0A3P7RZZ7_9FIRM|nr:competence/damage-inducible protein A [Petrocella atlantisensis]MCF8020618.1 competence/damage-inducible protein A [Vallitaleaceae bacterium]VDN46259.1 competence-damage inducible regulator [Petrocella atlantisensis]
MIGEIICVGNEILIGDTLNTNTRYLSKSMTNLGIEVAYQVVVGDHEERLLEAIETARRRSDVIVFTGGLGPTYDDMTKETVAKALDMTMVLDEAALEDMRLFFEQRKRTMAETNRKQAYRPSGGRMLRNENGTAPGIYIKDGETHYILLPGPPKELMPMFEKEVAPILETLSANVITSRIFQLSGIGESDLAEMIGHIMDISDNPRIAPYAKLGSVNIRVTAITGTKEEGKKQIEETTALLMPFLEPYCYSYEDKSLEEVVVQMIKEKNQTIAIAESCTGGLLSSRIINVPGVSKVYRNGFVTYSNGSKETWLKVPHALMVKEGAVSEAVAIAMAEGVAKVSDASIGVGITGIAGPDGGTPEKPVGMVCIGFTINGKSSANTFYFNGNRKKIRDYSVQYALTTLYSLLREI